MRAPANLPAERRGRVGILCLDAERLRSLRARQERDEVRRAARTRPEVRRAPRRLVCRETYLQRRPGALYIGTLLEDEAVRTLRRSGSGRFTEVLPLYGSRGIGWIRTSALCRS